MNFDLVTSDLADLQHCATGIPILILNKWVAFWNLPDEKVAFSCLSLPVSTNMDGHFVHWVITSGYLIREI